MAAKLIAAATSGLAMTTVLGLSALGGISTPTESAIASTPLCTTTGPLHGLSDAAATNARIVAARAEQRGGRAAALVAVTVGLTESHMLVLGNPTVQAVDPSAQGTGTDHDSLGIFQQRGSWGTAVKRMDPVASTDLFLDRLLKDAGWRTKAVETAAQDVQVSAFDGQPRAANNFDPRYGGNYLANVATAQALVDQIEQDAEALSCGTQYMPAAVAKDHGLPASYAIPRDATDREYAVIDFALAQLDKPYVFGAAGPAAFDCSGLVMAAWATVGVHLPHSTFEQVAAGTATSRSLLAPGDLVLVAGDDGTVAAPGHIGIYLGEGLVINAANEQVGIRVQPLDDFIRTGRGLSALRHLA